MQANKNGVYISSTIYGLLRHCLNNDEIVKMLDAMQNLILFGKTDYKPADEKQEYCWKRLKEENSYED